MYLLIETIRNQKDRLDLRQLRQRHTTLPAIAGGSIFRFEWRVTNIRQPLVCPRGEDHCWNWRRRRDLESRWT